MVLEKACKHLFKKGLVDLLIVRFGIAKITTIKSKGSR
jgi:hypothetical protein